MQESNPHTLLSPADFADTGQWRLIVYISQRGMRAILRHASDISRQPVEMLDTQWAESDRGLLLKNIENAVYDHPALLDDYATEIILETSRICFVPNEVLEQGDDDERAIFTALYPGGEPEIIAEHLDGMTALFSLADGLDGFISRTLPGARIRSHLGVLTSRFAKMHTQGRNIYADMRDAEVDIVAFDGSRLISASTQPWRHPDDVVYRIFNLLNAYDIDPADASIHISGTHEDRHTVVKTLRQLTSDASFTTLPPCATPLPLAMLLQAFRNG